MGVSRRSRRRDRRRVMGLDGRDSQRKVLRHALSRSVVNFSFLQHQFSVDERWKALRNSLAGLFCASLGSLDKLRTTSPTYSFRPAGSLPLFNQSHQLRHASLPSENVCTENLTPFVKLLPCKTSTGIASLLNPHRLFDADWHGMGVHVQWSPQNGISVQLSFQAVLDPVRYSSQRQRGKQAIYPVCDLTTECGLDFSFKTLFDRQISKACPVATDSVVDVVMAESEYNVVSPGPSFMEGDLAKFMVPECWFSQVLHVYFVICLH